MRSRRDGNPLVLSFSFDRLVRPLMALLIAVLSGSVVAADGPKAGETAPPLSVERLLNAPEGASARWGDLRGKVVIVEFWATWCAPCIANIPHLNELAERFRGKDVVFISLTAEPRETVEAFLKRKPIKGWVALDTDDRAGKAYGVSAIPYTFVIGRDSKVLGETHPADLDVEHIARALRGEPLGIKPVTRGETFGGAGVSVPRKPTYGGSFAPGRFPVVGSGSDGLPEPLAQVVVRPALEPEGGSSGGSAKNRQTWLNFDAASVVKSAYSRAYGVPDSRVDVKATLPQTRLDVVVWAPPGDIRRFRRLVEAGLGGAFGLAARAEDRQVDVQLLKVRNAGELKLTPTASTGGSMMNTKGGPSRVTATMINQTATGLASVLEPCLGVPVLDETGLTGGYDFEIILPKDLKEARESLRPLGLSLEPARRNLSYLVVESVGTD